MTDGELLMYGITCGALLMFSGVMLGAILIKKFGDRNGGTSGVDSPSSKMAPSTTPPIEREPHPNWRDHRKKKEPAPHQSVINLAPVVAQVEEDSIIIDLEKAEEEDNSERVAGAEVEIPAGFNDAPRNPAIVEAVLVDKPKFFLCHTCHKRGKKEPSADGKHYCNKHEPGVGE